MLEPSEYELIKRILQRLPDKVVLSNRKDKACAYTVSYTHLTLPTTPYV